MPDSRLMKQYSVGLLVFVCVFFCLFLVSFVLVWFFCFALFFGLGIFFLGCLLYSAFCKCCFVSLVFGISKDIGNRLLSKQSIWKLM